LCDGQRLSEKTTLSAMKKKVTLRMQHYLKLNFGSKTLAYDLLADYPTRPGKGIRPLFCLAATASVGADYNKAIDTATSIELLHNSFLIKDDIVDALQSGVNNYVVKPFTPQILKEKIDQIIANS
jgi:geranylgeranyl pyrophosphate synthase